jgi:hypothetical protein
MRASVLLLFALLPAAPLAAQFEGTITMKMSSPEMGNEAVEAKYYIKGDQFAMGMIAPASAGPMAGQEIRMLFNPAAQKMTMLMPVAGEMAAMMGGAKGIKMEMDLKDLPKEDAKAPEGSVKALGTSQTIAGRKCDDYEVTSEGEAFQMCLADGLGRFMMAAGGGMGRDASVPKWARNLAGKFPLKVSDKRGRGMMEVTAISEGAVPASAFTVPSDYRDMGGMMGGMGGMRRNN